MGEDSLPFVDSIPIVEDEIPCADHSMDDDSYSEEHRRVLQQHNLSC